MYCRPGGLQELLHMWGGQSESSQSMAILDDGTPAKASAWIKEHKCTKEEDEEDNLVISTTWADKTL